jgi:hypothetical protein
MICQKLYLQTSTIAEETVEAKIVFEHFASKVNVKVQFAENKFLEGGQAFTFCGVHAHFQNAVAEERSFRT